ncbi:MAG: ATP-binding protein [Clostridiales Family XIII bacterium]|jgi:AAA+ ATPase superfamily predicted ATPase|nr:ATP-binding protein [Clostridiales Family XIII bacterium]
MIGRKEEQRLLQKLALSDEAEFVVIYGRRRVGKTYLVRETFQNEFAFHYTGIANVEAQVQIAAFVKALRDYGWNKDALPNNWFDAFDGLRELIMQGNRAERAVIFLDEMPWMDNKKSNFIPAFEHFWNGWASGEKNLTLIVCGSAASWITKKIFQNKGGLYNRVTRQILLQPFTLDECREYYDSKGLILNAHDMIESYMIFGGIPYYLRMMDKKYSLALNVDALCFANAAPLKNEFGQLFKTLFAKPEKYTEVIEAINTKKKGLMREDIAALVGFSDGGNLTRILNELEESGFIRKYKPFGKKKNGALYQLSDPFTAFHLNFLQNIDSENYWSSFTDHAAHRAWSGYAFEQVCLAHITKIKDALGISGVMTKVSAWRSKEQDGDEKGAQIDLVLDRNDNVINLCEMKYANETFVVDKKTDLDLRNKAAVFKRETKTKKAIHLTLVTTYGVKPGMYANTFQSEITMEDLL